MEKKEPLCLKCAQRGKTCCQICEIYVTAGDFERVRGFTGRDDSYKFRVPEDPWYADQDDGPEWAKCVFRLEGSRRGLRRIASCHSIPVSAVNWANSAVRAGLASGDKLSSQPLSIPKVGS